MLQSKSGRIQVGFTSMRATRQEVAGVGLVHGVVIGERKWTAIKNEVNYGACEIGTSCHLATESSWGARGPQRMKTALDGGK